MQFTKMHGIGNDYLFINGFEFDVVEPMRLARVMSDRHRGVGSDGLILMLPPDPSLACNGRAHLRMRMFNADGSEAEMCGNGIRCVCKWAYDHQITPTIRSAKPMMVQTSAGVLALDYMLDADGKVDQVTVDMGEPVLDPERLGINMVGVKQIVNHASPIQFGSWAEAAGLDRRMTCVSVGNPHAVFYVQQAAEVPLEQIGPQIERHDLFANRINVHFVQVHNEQEVTIRTWERGSGVTLACGTGATAVCVAGVLTDRTGRNLQAHLPGGDLCLQWRESNHHVYLTGPAAEVFEGHWKAGT